MDVDDRFVLINIIILASMLAHLFIYCSMIYVYKLQLRHRR